MIETKKEIAVPAIRVARLSDYEQMERLAGSWIEIHPHTTEDDLRTKIGEIIGDKSEKWIIVDSRKLLKIELLRCLRLEKILEVGKAIHTYRYPIIKGYLSLFGIEAIAEIAERFLGIYENMEDYADEYLDEYYGFPRGLSEVSDFFDYKEFSESLLRQNIVRSVYLSGGKIAVFKGVI